MMNWEELLSDKRIGLTKDNSRMKKTSVRSEFERDYDRLVFSPAFRRLQNKTQVFPLPGKIFVHNRLTHSLEVSCIGRSLGAMISKVLSQRHKSKNIEFIGEISSIVSSACLAHDLGNPPFGHNGEAAIGAYFKESNGKSWIERVKSEGGRWQDFTLFEGNANGLRLLTHQFQGKREGGFALTYSTVASIIKYPWSSEDAGGKNKFGYLHSEEETIKDIAKELGLIDITENKPKFVRYPLVYLVEAADDICYQIMDIEDAYKLNIFSLDETKDLLFAFMKEEDIHNTKWILETISDTHEQIAYIRSRVINSLVEKSAEIFLDSEDMILSGKFEHSLLHHLPDAMLNAYKRASEQAHNRIYKSREVLDIELAGHNIFQSLLDKILGALDNPEFLYSQAVIKRMPYQFVPNQKTTYDKVLCSLDYLSSMTDVYALDLFRQMTGMNLPSI